VDRVNSLILPGVESSQRVSLDDDVAAGIVRYRTDLSNSSSLGGLAVWRRGGDYDHYQLAADGAIRIGRSQRVRFATAGSRTDDAPSVQEMTGRAEGSFGGLADIRYDLDLRNWAAEARWRAISTGFRADAGLLQRVGFMGPEFQIVRTLWGGEAGWYNRVRFGVEGQRLTDLTGAVIDQKIEVSASYEGPWQSEIEALHTRRRDAFAGQLFPRAVTELSAFIMPSDVLSVGASLEFGDEIDTEDVRPARFHEIKVDTAIRIGRSSAVSASAGYQELSVAQGRLFRALLAQSRIEQHFGLRWSFRAILQHRDVHRDPALFVGDVAGWSNRLFSQLLLRYQLGPYTVAYAGYSGTVSDFAGLDVAPDERSFFIKFGYAFSP
jgi:hypothetical protein